MPQSSGCSEFQSWSDGGGATHTITVPAQGATYTATFRDACPRVTTGEASGIGLDTATVNGTVNPNGLQASYWFEYGPTTAYGSETDAQPVGPGMSDEAVSRTLSGLAPATTYHYRLVASSSAGTTHGADRIFTTQTPSPLVVSLPFSEGLGTTAFDASGNGNDAELLNGAAWGPGRVGGGLALDGTNDFAAIDDAPSLAFGNGLTVAAWVQRTSAPAGWHNLVSRQYLAAAAASRHQLASRRRAAGPVRRYRAASAQRATTATTADQFFLAFKDATPYFGVNTPNGGTAKAGVGSVPLGQWVHLAGTYNGARIILYVNGAERARVIKTGALVASSRPVLLGANANGPDPLVGSEFLAGGLDEARLFSRALTASEVAALAAGF